MSTIDQAARVDQYTRGEPAPPVWVQVTALRRADPTVALHRARDVIRIVAARQASGDWPDDAWWSRELPGWFCDSFKARSLDETLLDPEAWDFGSWLDAVKDPGWEWWSSMASAGGWEINLTAYNDPYSLGPLLYLCRVAGVDALSVCEREQPK